MTYEVYGVLIQSDHFRHVAKQLTSLLAMLLVFPAFVNAQPAAQMTATRTSGPAPLAVLFDATGTTHSDSAINTFRQLGYYFDFDDPNSGVWSTNGLSKNREIGGPLAAHVFDRPGVYRVGVRAQDAQGRWSDAWQTITVTDPNTVYSGSNTVVISRGTDFTGAPSGALRIGNANSWPNFESGKRYLLKAGDDFRSLGRIYMEDVSDFQIGSFGSGAKPMVSSVFISMDEDNAANPPRNGVVQNLNTISIRQQIMFNHLLVYKNTLIGTGAGISNGGAVDWYATNQRGTSSLADWKWCQGFFVVENHVDMNMDYTGPRNPIQGGGKWFTVLGNYSTNAREHTLRAFYTYRSIIGHNELTGLNERGAKHALKMHARGTQDWHDSMFPDGSTTINNPRSQYIRVHNNVLGNDRSLNSWTMQVAPQNDASLEGMQDVVVESNRFVASSSTLRDFQSLGNHVTERGNEITRGVYTVSSYPSNYPNSAFWHGPYYMGGQMPATSAPARSEEVVQSPPVSPVLSLTVSQ